MQNTAENHRTARHNGTIKAPSPGRVKAECRKPTLTLLQAFCALRDLNQTDIGRATGLPDVTIYRVLNAQVEARDRTLGAIAEFLSMAAGRAVSIDQVRELAARRISDPDRVSDEIAEALAAGAQ